MAIGYIVFICGISAFSLSKYINSKRVEEVEEVIWYDGNLKKSDADSVISIIETEGFHETFTHYSSFRDINDVKFHQLRQQYINAVNDLTNYLHDMSGKEM